jgi:hypothetical protein
MRMRGSTFVSNRCEFSSLSRGRCTLMTDGKRVSWPSAKSRTTQWNGHVAKFGYLLARSEETRRFDRRRRIQVSELIANMRLSLVIRITVAVFTMGCAIFMLRPVRLICRLILGTAIFMHTGSYQAQFFVTVVWKMLGLVGCPPMPTFVGCPPMAC